MEIRRPLICRRLRWVVAPLIITVLGLFPPPTGTQVFLASTPHPQFAIGPLFITASVRPDLGPVTVSVSWSTVTPPISPPDVAKRDLYLFWAEIAAATAPGAADLELARHLEAGGFATLAEGRVILRTRDRAKLGTSPRVIPRRRSPTRSPWPTSRCR